MKYPSLNHRRLLTLALIVLLVGCTAIVVLRDRWRDGRKLPDVAFIDPNTDTPPRTQYKTFHSATINGPANYLIYLPAGYDISGERRYPVIYWLHGLDATPRSGASFVTSVDAAIAAGDCPPVIVVLVNGLVYSRYYDSKDGTMPVESVFIKDLIPHIDQSYRTDPSRRARAIEGFSMGGFGAIRFAFKYPELFRAATSLSGAIRDASGIRGSPHESWTNAHFQKVFGGDVEYYRITSPQVLAEQNTETIRRQVVTRLISGESDEQTPFSQQFARQLKSLSIPYELTIIPGVSHDQNELYRRLGTKHFVFYRELFSHGRLEGDTTN